MENFIFDTQKDENPKIFLHFDNHLLEFKGKSWPEDTRGVYEPALVWIDQYNSYLKGLDKADVPEKINCKFEFLYLNSATSVVVREILEKMIDIKKTLGTTVNVDWNYIEQDDDILGLGKELEEYTDLAFMFNPVSLN